MNQAAVGAGAFTSRRRRGSSDGLNHKSLGELLAGEGHLGVKLFIVCGFFYCYCNFLKLKKSKLVFLSYFLKLEVEKEKITITLKSIGW